MRVWKMLANMVTDTVVVSYGSYLLAKRQVRIHCMETARLYQEKARDIARRRLGTILGLVPVAITAPVVPETKTILPPIVLDKLNSLLDDMPMDLNEAEIRERLVKLGYFC